jgi:hypothetical protein
MGRHSKISAEDFVTAWQTSHSLEEVAEKTGLLKGTASARAAYYRKRGVGLKLYRRGGPPIDIKALASLANQLCAGDVDEERRNHQDQGVGEQHTNNDPN